MVKPQVVVVAQRLQAPVAQLGAGVVQVMVIGVLSEQLLGLTSLTEELQV